MAGFFRVKELGRLDGMGLDEERVWKVLYRFCFSAGEELGGF